MRFHDQTKNRSAGRNNDSLFSHFGMEKPGLDLPKPRTLFMGFGLWFAFCLVFGLGSIGALVYVAFHFLSKVW